VKDRNNVTITWERPLDATSFIIESRENFSTPWVAIDDVSGENMEYHITNLSSGYHYYRIVSVDRMGYTNSDMEGDFLQIFIEAEVIASNVEDDGGEISNELYLVAGFLLTVAASSAFYLLRGRDLDEETQESIVVSALEAESQTGQISEEEFDEPESDFGILSGSEFSKQVVFVCEKGCQMEFNAEGDEEEIMCPHCGIMGESPL
ncbi:MAG: fibronectin type III domain-containing protein, partial [Candidatus Thermoplasmatota archaeon]|nr:fibronectin type III domain-containing protein [Candidatus Thermoplasmatota archaeon]